MMDIRDVDSPTVNPYWDEVRKLPSSKFSYRTGAWSPAFSFFDAFSAEELTELLKDDNAFLSFRGRDVFAEEYSFAIPDPESLNFISSSLPSGSKIVEIGAGNGYWAYQLQQLGFDVKAYDLQPRAHSWHPVEKGDSRRARIGFDVLFLCWPPYATSMAYDCLSAFNGEYFLYIGEGRGGCTGDDDFFQELKNWQLVESHNNVVYSGIHDRIEIYKKL